MARTPKPAEKLTEPKLNPNFAFLRDMSREQIEALRDQLTDFIAWKRQEEEAEVIEAAMKLAEAKGIPLSTLVAGLTGKGSRVYDMSEGDIVSVGKEYPPGTIFRMPDGSKEWVKKKDGGRTAKWVAERLLAKLPLEIIKPE